MKKYLIILFIFFIYSNLLFSQTKIDSLESQLEKATGIEKVDILNELGKAYWNESPQKAVEYGNQALELSQKLDYIKGEAQALKNIGIGYYYFIKMEKLLEPLVLAEISQKENKQIKNCKKK